MADNTTHVIYKALADFSSLRKEARQAKKEFADLKAAEQAFNTASGKNTTAATNAAKARTSALKDNAKAAGSATTAIGKQLQQLRAATKAIQAQNRSLKTNTDRLTAATGAASAYAAAQKKIASSTGKTIDTKALRNEATARKEATQATEDQTEALDQNTESYKRGKKAVVEFVEEVGEVDQATGEVTKSVDANTKSTNGWAAALSKVSNHLRGNTAEAQRLARAQDVLDRARTKQADTAAALHVAELRLQEVLAKQGAGSAAAAAAELRVTRARRQLELATIAADKALADFNGEGGKLPPVLNRIASDGERVNRMFKRLGNWRPRLTPPFIALVPIIGAVIAAINPLIALLGAVGPVALGLASQIGSLSGAFLALPGILSAVVGGIASVIASMGGVGNVFKTYSAMNKALGKTTGGGGQSQAERAEALADAERNLARAQRNVQKAQENLNKARQRAVEDLIDLRREVSRASLNEERAIADLQQARDAYNNTMADPSSQAGDKLDAAARIKEAEADLEDVRRTNIENQQALTEAERRGVDQSEQVLDAQDSLTDAYDAQADALRNLRKEQSGGSAGAAAVTAVNEYQEALAKLSPSARAVVLALIGLQDQWQAMRSDLQENFFSQFVGDMDRLPRLIQTLGNFLRPASVAMGKFVSNFLRLVDSPEWSRDLTTIGEQNGTVISKLGDAALFLMTALKDLMIAAGPFTEWMVTGFAEGSKNFSEFIANARETGSLAAWLEKVEGRLQQWWRIIKNIGGSLFNYSAAASDFGQWLTDGFEKTTEGWLDASKRAREEGSPFQEYLENVKPLLSEVKGLFGDFFRWFGRESMEVGNIDGATRLLQILRNDLGPALANIFDTLAETNIDEQFLHALSRIVEFVDSIMRAGGNAVLTSFFDVVSGFFDTLAQFFSMLPPGSLAALGTFFGTVAALSFIGKFTGITNLIGGLLSLVPQTGKLGGIFGGLTKLNGMKFLGVAGMIAALVSLPDITKGIGEAWQGMFGIDTSTLEKAAKEIARTNKENAGWGFGATTDGFKANEFNQSRNWVFDAGRNLTGTGDRTWQKVDDELRAILDTGDMEAFRQAWSTVVNEVGSDASQIWSLTLKDANDAGAGINDTSEKVRKLGEESAESERKIEQLRGELDLIGGTTQNKGEAFDTLAESIQRLGELPKIDVGDLDAQTDEARSLRDGFREIESNARNAAQAVLDNGGSVEEAQAKYDEGRRAIEEYLIQMGLGPEQARLWADGQLGPADEVRQKFADIKAEMDKIDTNKKIEFELSWKGLLGPQDPNAGKPGFDQFGNPTTMVNGKPVVDFGAMGKGNKGATPGPTPTPSPGAAPMANLNIGVNDAVKKDTDAAKGTWATFWSNFNSPVGGPLGALVSALAATAANSKSQGTDPLKSNTKGALKDIELNGFNPFRSVAGALPSQFQGIVNGIATAWDRLKAAFRDPIQFVIDTVYTNGIQKLWNNVQSVIKVGSPLPNIKFAEGGVLPGYTPGRDVHHFRDQHGNGLSLSGGEGIMRPEFVRAVGGKKGVDELNMKARRGEAFASGGVFGNAGRKPGTGGSFFDFLGDVGKNIAGVANSVLGSASKLLQDPMGFLTNGFGMVDMNGVGSTPYADLLRGIPRKIIDTLIPIGKSGADTMRSKQEQDLDGGGPAPANVMGWRAQWAAVNAAFPSARLNSSFRKGDPLYHGKGRAIDVTPSMAIFNWIKKNYPNSRELIYTPAGGRQLHNGKEGTWPANIARAHHDHVHWAMKKGGVLPQLFDNGGMLKHGQLGLNLTGKPEAVLDPNQTNALQSLLSGVGLMQRQMLGLPGQASQIAGSAPQIVDNSVNIENLTIQNAVPEKPSESLPKALRKIGYMQSAREDA